MPQAALDVQDLYTSGRVQGCRGARLLQARKQQLRTGSTRRRNVIVFMGGNQSGVDC
jgi:hypothetical protein